ncbi:MAG TPA: ABC transporter ATP-binding protein [Nocardioidaceae bacterium]|nr:ABC transporter ATP-binding protein [Nocardioidaceae bacterium]
MTGRARGRDQPAAPTAPSLLEVRNLTTHIRMRQSTVEAVGGISFSIRPGETVGLVGESGSGKSVTALSLMQLLPPNGAVVDGSVVLDGRDLIQCSEAQLRRIRGNEVAMVFQDPMTALNPTMTIGNQIAEPLRIHRGASRREAMDRAAEILTMVGMPRPLERLNAYPHQLSGGLRQRVMIAIALSCEPKLLIADEPTTALDVTIQSQILSLLDELRQRLHMGLLLITHDMGVIAGRADRVLVMYAGRIVEAGETSTLFHRMRHPYTQALLESMPDLETDRSQALYSIPGSPPTLAPPPEACRFAPRCRYAQPRCRLEDPPTLDGETGHPYACFFPVAGPVLPATTPTEAEAASPVPSSTPPPREAAPAVAVAAPAAEVDEAEPPLLVLDEVVKEFPIGKGLLRRQAGSIKAVSGVSLEIARGETFGLVGESGCGKTTLGRLMVAAEPLTSGSIQFAGVDMSRLRGRALRRARRDVQLMFQDPYSSLDPRMRISSTLREPLQAQQIGNRAQQDARIRELLRQVGLAPTAVDLHPHEFSGGQRQRIGFARALTLEPKLVIADEPVSALDVSIQAQVLNVLRSLQEQHDLTYVIISHDLSVVRYLADRIGVMYLGKLVEIGPAAEIYDGPAHPYTAGLLAAVPLPDPERERAKSAAPVEGELPSPADPPSGCRFRTRCPLAQDICAQVEPPLRPFGIPQHTAACHFPLRPPLAAGWSGGSGQPSG